MRKVSRECLDALYSNAPALVDRLMQRALTTTDDRVLAVVTDKVLAYVVGHTEAQPKVLGQAESGLDTSHLTAEETAEALHCCERLAHFLALVEQRKRGVVVEAEAVG